MNKETAGHCAEALQRLRELLDQARRCGLPEPTAFVLATANDQGRPSARTVLLKKVDERGFVFYTSLLSRKGRQLSENPHAALCFFWQPLMEQVTVEGIVEPVSDAEADAYWISRPRLSQLGAWASRQSRRLPRKELFNLRVAAYGLKFASGPVPRPPAWIGLRVIPNRIEFWKRGPFRWHERVLYELQDGQWQRWMLCP